MQALDRCPKCGGLVHPKNTQKVQKTRDAVFVIYQHGDCGAVNQRFFRPADYKRYKAKYEGAQEGESLVGYDPEAVGIIVQGFRVDLDAVKTLADIELYWRAQHSESVPEEGER